MIFISLLVLALNRCMIVTYGVIAYATETGLFIALIIIYS
jgi:hypothetical protein